MMSFGSWDDDIEQVSNHTNNYRCKQCRTEWEGDSDSKCPKCELAILEKSEAETIRMYRSARDRSDKLKRILRVFLEDEIDIDYMVRVMESKGIKMTWAELLHLVQE
jgi:DNA-directed RNA polymerase subunit RPC12/RpoP